MKEPVSLHVAERQVFQATVADGLWDVLIGCFVLEFSLAPLFSEHLGDFWSSAIFFPFWGLVYLAIRLIRKYMVTPRTGRVSFGKARKRKLHRFNLVMIGINIIFFVLGILAFLYVEKLPSGRPIELLGSFTYLVGLFMLTGLSVSAYLLDYPRLYIYGLLLFAAPLIGEWLYLNHGASHHGFPIVFGFCAGVMIITGLVLFWRLLKNNPVIENNDV